MARQLRAAAPDVIYQTRKGVKYIYCQKVIY